MLPAHFSRFTRATAFNFIQNLSCRNITRHKYLFSVTAPQIHRRYLSEHLLRPSLSLSHAHIRAENRQRKTLLNDWSRYQRAKSHPMKKEICSLDLGGRGECLEVLFSCQTMADLVTRERIKQAGWKARAPDRNSRLDLFVFKGFVTLSLIAPFLLPDDNVVPAGRRNYFIICSLRNIYWVFTCGQRKKSEHKQKDAKSNIYNNRWTDGWW